MRILFRTASGFRNRWDLYYPKLAKTIITYKTLSTHIYKEELGKYDVLIEDANANYKQVLMEPISAIPLKITILSDEHRKHVPFSYLKRFDAACVKNEDHTPVYKMKYLWMPNCAFTAELDNRSNVINERKYDISFIGKRIKGRKVCLSKLIEENPFLNFKNYIHDRGKISYLNLIDIYQNSKIVINESTPELDLNLRTFEAMISGALLITNNCKNGIDRLFVDKEHCVYYKDYEDLKFQIKYYLKHNEEREKIAQCGKLEVLKNHTEVNRSKFLEEVVNDFFNSRTKTT